MEQPTSKLQCNILISPSRMDVPAADDWCFRYWIRAQKKHDGPLLVMGVCTAGYVFGAVLSY
ncbi:hypothetical protein MGG_17228 [Pyricularia oryzae 70-15]|uniref:Uncharacterized protein n=1 Tax=Pyricularia oryzae (strain 70-15 / ATCC MYA-4617 / FGSC 8958) TaxID=242507 RepID=G4N904_PYRO7|nr:uncharacterized protein MGG_17228 [Pyricularia oryzae 70-15]EHA51099.1 hypothetical protein MGG_17228 [Pyricularia oryzae 70-15]